MTECPTPAGRTSHSCIRHKYILLYFLSYISININKIHNYYIYVISAHHSAFHDSLHDMPLNVKRQSQPALSHLVQPQGCFTTHLLHQPLRQLQLLSSTSEVQSGVAPLYIMRASRGIRNVRNSCAYMLPVPPWFTGSKD